MNEQVITFGPRLGLVGVITWPSQARGGPVVPASSPQPNALPAVLLLNSGLLHRVGPNRIYVKLARHLASLGFVVLRFDLSGIGDSPPRDDRLPFERSSLQEIEQAMAALRALAGSTRYVLMGLCSGAQVAFAGALHHPSVIGAALINAGGHLHDEQDEELSMALFYRALRRHYQRIALHSSFRAKNLRKLLTGDLNLTLLWSAARHFRLRYALRGQQTGPDLREIALARLAVLSERRVRLLHVYSEGDQGFDYFHLLLGKQADTQPVELIRGANHTFSTLWSQERLVQTICEWARAFAP